MSSERIWNRRAAGIPSALVLGFGIAAHRLMDIVATLAWRGNLNSLGGASRIQRGVTIRFPARVDIGRCTSLARGVSITTEKSDGFCRIGSEVIVGNDVRLDFSGGLVIGDNVVISERSALFTHAHGLNPKSIPEKAPLEVESDVWIGAGVTVIEGTTRIGRGSVIASGTVLTKPVPPHSLVAGVPGRVIRTIE